MQDGGQDVQGRRVASEDVLQVKDVLQEKKSAASDGSAASDVVQAGRVAGEAVLVKQDSACGVLTAKVMRL